MYWYNVTPKGNAPANGIYQYEQHVKGIDPKPSPPEFRSNAYKVGEPVWVKPADCRCTTRFCKGQVDGVISPQTVLVNGTPRHVKDLRRRNELAVTEEDESNTLSGSEMRVIVTCESGGQHSSALLTSEEDTKDEDDQTSKDGGNAGNLTEEDPILPRRSTPPPYHICDHEIKGKCSENWGKNHHLPQCKRQRICSTCKIYCFDRKKHGCPERAYITNILQMVTYFHTGSHVKTRGVKMRKQMKAGRKEQVSLGAPFIWPCATSKQKLSKFPPRQKRT